MKIVIALLVLGVAVVADDPALIEPVESPAVAWI